MISRLYLFFLLTVGMLSCRKDQANAPTEFHDLLVNEFDAHLCRVLSAEDLVRFDRSTLCIISADTQTVLAKIVEQGGDGRFILMVKSSNGFKSTLIDMSDLVSREQHMYTGHALINHLEDGVGTSLFIENNKVIKVGSLNNARGNNALTNTRLMKEPLSSPDNPSYLDNFVVTAVSGSESTKYFSLYWIFSQQISYEGAYVGSGSGTGGSSSNGNTSGPSGITALKTIAPDDPIKDLVAELACFTIDERSKYSISINVNQPVPKNRAVSDLTARFMVGHAFFTITQTRPNGTTTTRNFGFYPKTKAKLGHPRDAGIFGEDSNTPHCVSLKVNVTSNEFDVLKNELLDYQSSTYDLYNFNCTNAVLNAFNSIGIHLPSTRSVDPLFDGNDPADLAEDIRELNLNKFSAENGNRAVTRTVSNRNDILPPAKVGKC